MRPFPSVAAFMSACLAILVMLCTSGLALTVLRTEARTEIILSYYSTQVDTYGSK